MYSKYKSWFIPRLVLVAFVGIVLTFVMLVGLTKHWAYAQDSNRGFTVSPLVFELSANPGDKLTQTLKVDNITNEPMNIAADLRNFVARGEEGQPGLTTEDTSFSLASWMEVTPAEGVIPAKGSQTFKLTISAPLNAEPGGHFGSVVFKTKPSTGEGNIAVVQEIGALVLLKVAGEVKESANIESFSVKPGFSENGPFNFELRLKNSGNVHYKPIINITVTNMFGKEVARLQVDGRNVLPDSIRKFTAQFEKKWLWGRHTATATVVYGSTNQVLVAQTKFWAFPVKAGLITLGVIAVLAILGYLGRRRLKLAMKVLFGKEKEISTPPKPRPPKHRNEK